MEKQLAVLFATHGQDYICKDLWPPVGDNSYAIQSSSVPGVRVHVWDEEAFNKLSPSLLHQQPCLV